MPDANVHRSTAGPLLSVTDAARLRLEGMAARNGSGMLRISAGIKGCAGMSWNMDWVEAPQPRDEIVPTDGGQVAVDPKALLFVAGSTLDFEQGALSSRLTISGSPAIGGLCGCGESFRPC